MEKKGREAFRMRREEGGGAKRSIQGQSIGGTKGFDSSREERGLENEANKSKEREFIRYKKCWLIVKMLFVVFSASVFCAMKITVAVVSFVLPMMMVVATTASVIVVVCARIQTDYNLHSECSFTNTATARKAYLRYSISCSLFIAIPSSQ